METDEQYIQRTRAIATLHYMSDFHGGVREAMMMLKHIDERAEYLSKQRHLFVDSDARTKIVQARALLDDALEQLSSQIDFHVEHNLLQK